MERRHVEIQLELGDEILTIIFLFTAGVRLSNSVMA